MTGNDFYIIILAVLWTIPWKGVALWRSARRGERIWFIVMLIINTLGILEILYIFLFSKKRKVQIAEIPQNN
ncbi:MAG TPA: DUF5652 family protein [Candidatus Moranbacteria bacterium]|nr:DUF5652 family protein [Candidatus Moranbacteria bacterium]